MKVAILGASGATGIHLVTQAKERGHDVTAVVRASSYSPPAGITVKRGDLTAVAFLREAVRGQDAVLSGLGLRLNGIAPWNKPEVPDFLTRFSKALVEAMKAEETRRIIAVSSGGVGDSYDKVPVAFQAFMKLSALRHVMPELNRMEQTLMTSGLDVTIVRPTGLTEGPRTNAVKVCEKLGGGRATISRADVAAFVLDELDKRRYVGQTPMITETGA